MLGFASLSLILLISVAIGMAKAQEASNTNVTRAQSFEVAEQTVISQTDLGMDVTCPRYESDLLPISDCSRAMLKFPQNLDTHIFMPGGGSGSPRDIYKLPSERSHGDCLMRVDLVSVQQDLSSWLAIGTVALQLTMACANQRQQWGFGRTGGTTTTGSNGKIKITLTRNKPSTNVAGAEQSRNGAPIDSGDLSAGPSTS